MAMLSCVAMSKVTPPAGAGNERLTVKVNVVVPLLPSAAVISLIEILGTLQSFKGELVLCGLGVPVAKSVLLLFVSVQPFPALISAVVLLGAGARPAPSKQLAVVP